jgi:hypothetical protein
MLYCSSRKHTTAGNWRLQNKTIVRWVIFFRMDSSTKFLTTVCISFSVAQHDVTHHPTYQLELLSSRTVSTCVFLHAVGWTVGIDSPHRRESSPSSPRHRRWGSPSILCSWYRVLFPRWQSGRSVNLTSNLHMVLRLSVRGAICFQMLGISSFKVRCHVSRVRLSSGPGPSLGSTQPHIQWSPGIFLRGQSRPDREALLTSI